MPTDQPTPAPPDTLAVTLDAVGRVPLGRIPAACAARIRRRVVDAEAIAPRLDYAAFNSAATA
jgi:FXSXX-COOH protein